MSSSHIYKTLYSDIIETLKKNGTFDELRKSLLSDFKNSEFGSSIETKIISFLDTHLSNLPVTQDLTEKIRIQNELSDLFIELAFLFSF